MSERRRLVVDTPEGVDQTVAPWLWALEDCRRRTLDVLAGLSDEDVDRAGADGTTVATLLHHIAAIEASWLYEDVLQRDFPPDVEAVLTHEVRDVQGRLQRVAGEPMAAHLRRLETVRAALKRALTAMDSDDLHRVRALPQYDVTPGWVLHHLLQHEAEHRGAIAALAGKSER